MQDAPVYMKSVRVEQAKTACKIFVTTAWKHVAEENLIAVALVHVNVAAVAAKLFKLLDALRAEVNEMELIK